MRPLRAVLALVLALAAGMAIASGSGSGSSSGHDASRATGKGKDEAPRIMPVSPPVAANAFPSEILDRMRKRLVALDGNLPADPAPHVPFPPAELLADISDAAR